MPPRKIKAAVTPSRRSARLASKDASSVASSEGPEPDPADKVRPRPRKKAEQTTLGEWNTSDVIYRIVWLGEYQLVPTLTLTQCQAVILGLSEQNRNIVRAKNELQDNMYKVSKERNAALELPTRMAGAEMRAFHTIYQAHIEATQGPTLMASPPERTAKEQKDYDDLVDHFRKSKPPSSDTSLVPSSVTTAIVQPTSSTLSPSSAQLASDSLSASTQTTETPRVDSQPYPRWRRLVEAMGRPMAGRKRVAEGASGPVQKRARVETTPKVSHSHQQTRGLTGPSAQNPDQPTSLSIISENTEPSFFSGGGSDPTPSKQSRLAPLERSVIQPQPARLHSIAQVPTVTRRPRSVSRGRRSRRQESREETPSRPPNRSSPKRKTPPPRDESATTVSVSPFPLPALTASGFGNRSYSWEPEPQKSAASSTQDEVEVDVRLEKLRRLHMLQDALEELHQDEDIQSMRRSKRVKVDHLSSIPHNRPGDSPATFRVPEFDSDDEMDVDTSFTSLNLSSAASSNVPAAPHNVFAGTGEKKATPSNVFAGTGEKEAAPSNIFAKTAEKKAAPSKMFAETAEKTATPSSVFAETGEKRAPSNIFAGTAEKRKRDSDGEGHVVSPLSTSASKNAALSTNPLSLGPKQVSSGAAFTFKFPSVGLAPRAQQTAAASTFSAVSPASLGQSVSSAYQAAARDIFREGLVLFCSS